MIFKDSFFYFYMNKPDYDGGSIVNLISSIGRVCKWKSRYNELRILKSEELKKSQKIVLMIIDGLGYEFLMKHGGKTAFNENLRGKITSVFPSSTSAAVTALMTGDSPQEHGMPGWYMFSKEFGSQIIPLPFVLRANRDFKLGHLTDIKDIFKIEPISKKFKVKVDIIQPMKVKNSAFTLAASENGKRHGYNSMDEYFKIIKKLVKKKGRRFIYAYYSEHDTLSHDYGLENKKTLRHFKKLAKKLRSFLKSLDGKGTTIIITADHGATEVYESKLIYLKDHPKLKDTLRMPLCGEHRFAYCYVKPDRIREFEKYIKTKLKYACDLYRSEDLLKKGYFGKFQIHKNFRERIGDYILLMKEHYGIYDLLIHQKSKGSNKGDHGGLSEEELYVPLIVVNK